MNAIAPEPRAGEHVGEYVLVARVGRGSSGSVFRARDAADRSVTVKVLEPLLTRDAVARLRFDHEIKAARALRHPNVVPILDEGDIGGRRFLVMPWYANGSLADELAFVGPLAAARLATAARDVGAGLEAIHAGGLVHRDVKPGNVMLAAGGHFAVTDFGLARGPAFTRVTRADEVVGTPEYLAPELVLGQPATSRSDVYAFACLLFECVAGTTPFSGRPVFDLLRAHLEEPPPDPLVGRGDLPATLRSALLAGLEKSPERRPAGPADLAAGILEALGAA